MAFENEVQNFTSQGTDLPESKLSTGFLPGEKPPANWFNSLIYRLSQATRELQSKAVEKEYVDEQLKEASGDITEIEENLSKIEENLNQKATVTTFETIIPISGWNDVAPYYVDIEVTGILDTDKPHIAPIYTGTLQSDQAKQEAWNVIDRVVASTDSIRVYAFEEMPTVEIPVQIQVVR